MTNKHNSELADLVAYQRSLCDEETLLALDRSTRPSPDRFRAVARGKSEWTAQEREVIDANPSLREYEARMRAAVTVDTRDIKGVDLFSLAKLPAGVRLHMGILRVECTAPDSPLLRVMLCDQSGVASDSGFLAFARVRRGEGPQELVSVSEADIRALFPTVSEITEQVFLQLQAQTVESLGAEDHAVLVRSFNAATSRCRSALAAALNRVRHVYGAQLPAAAFGAPRRQVPVAMLPTDDEELRALARRSVAAVRSSIRGDKAVIVGAGEWAFGRCALDRFDRVRWLDAVTTAQLEAMAQPVPSIPVSASETVSVARADAPTASTTRAINPKMVQQTLERLAEFEQADDECALAGQVYRLSIFADINEAATTLGLSVEEASDLLRSANQFLAGEIIFSS